MALSLQDFIEIEKLGNGGMGEVFTAFQVSLNRKVVLKKMTQSTFSGSYQDEQFEKWATLAASLDHDNIIPIYDFGIENGEKCFTMEYIDGSDLEKLLIQNPFPREIGLMIALQALKGLHFIHQKGLVHGDFKPNNILVSKTGMVKVTDFELASSTSQAPSLSNDSVCFITPAYMSPEAAKQIVKLELSGNALLETTPITAESMSNKDTFEAVNISGDIWSAGVLLYRILCGKLPFSGETFSDLFNSIINSREPDFLPYMPFIPNEFTNAITACLAKEPQSRLSSLDPVIKSLEFFISDIGFRDIEKEIRKYMADKNSAIYDLEKILLVYHARMASKCRALGDADKGGAHDAEFKKLDQKITGFDRPDSITPAGAPFLITVNSLLLNRLKTFAKIPIFLTDALNALVNATFGMYSFLTTSRAPKIALTTSLIIFIYIGTGISLYYIMHPKIKTRGAGELTNEQMVEPAEAKTPPLQANTIDVSKNPDQVSASVTPIHKLNYRKLKLAIAPDRKKSDLPENGKELAENPKTKQKKVKYAILKLALQPLTAVVLLDGKDLSMQDIENGKSVEPGLHALIAQAPGFDPYQDTLTVEPGLARVVKITLTQTEKAVGLLHVYSYPWSDLYVDGALQGTTPTPKPLAFLEGEHTLQLKRQGYKPYSETIRLKKGQVTRIQINLERSELSENLSH